MADHADNVVVFPHWDRPSRKPLAHIDTLRTATEQLQKLSYYLHELPSHADWSAQRWMVASTPFRMRIAGMRRRLADLSKISSTVGQTDISWAFELSHACYKAERLLGDIDVCLQMLQRGDTAPAERVKEIRNFSSGRSEVLHILSKIRHLLAQQFPIELGDS